jgi:hypothetical protein
MVSASSLQGALLHADNARDVATTEAVWPTHSLASNTSRSFAVLIDEIQHVQPQSPHLVVVIAIAVTTIAFIVVVLELAFPSLPWSVVHDRWRARSGLSTGSTTTDGTTAYCRRYKWKVLASNIVVVGLLDFYWQMPAMFIAGEAQAMGLSVSFSGTYVGLAMATSFFSVFAVPHLSTIMSMNDLVRISCAFFALLTTPQGFANVVGGGAAAFSALLMSLRLLEGIPYGFIETVRAYRCAATRGIPPSSPLSQREREPFHAHGMGPSRAHSQVSATLLNKAFPPEELGNAMALSLSSRFAFGMLSGPAGALTYSLGGLTLPYALTGLLAVLTVPLLRCLQPAEPTCTLVPIDPTAVPLPSAVLFSCSEHEPFTHVQLIRARLPAAASENASLWIVVSNPMVLASMFLTFWSTFVHTSMDVVWQPWLGVSPYGYDSSEISTVSLAAVRVHRLDPTAARAPCKAESCSLPCSACVPPFSACVPVPVPMCSQGFMFFSATILVAMPLHAGIGDLPALIVGTLIFMVSCLFLGSPPPLFPSLQASLWLPYAVTCVRVLGVSIVSVSSMALPMKALVKVMDADEAAAPLSVLQVLLSYLGFTLGPLTSGPIMEAVGVGGLALCHLGVFFMSSVVAIAVCYPIMTVGPDAKQEEKCTPRGEAAP